jgi:hypothetical protein
VLNEAYGDEPMLLTTTPEGRELNNGGAM